MLWSRGYAWPLIPIVAVMVALAALALSAAAQASLGTRVAPFVGHPRSLEISLWPVTNDAPAILGAWLASLGVSPFGLGLSSMVLVAFMAITALFLRDADLDSLGLAIALGLFMGGVAATSAELMARGSSTDYISIAVNGRLWAVINLADLAYWTGGVLFAWTLGAEIVGFVLDFPDLSAATRARRRARPA